MTTADEIAELEAMVRAMASRLARMKARSAGEPATAVRKREPSPEMYARMAERLRKLGG